MNGDETLALSFRNVTRRYADRVVFRELSADVPARGVTFVVGRSGIGKSVLCRLGIGLERPDAGEVQLFGRSLSGLGERRLLRLRRQAPYLVQGPALLDWLSVAQNVALADPKAAPQTVAHALDRVGLRDVADRLPTELGPGVRKRAAIARALVLQPRFLLFDEPTTGLDRAGARQVSEVLVALRNEGLGALVVSHDYPLLQQLADRVLLVVDGQARTYGTRDAFLSSSDPEVRALLDPARAEMGRHG